MNSYARRMIRDGRYRSERTRRRDRGEYNEPYRDNEYNAYERNDGHYHREYDEYPYEEVRGNFEYSRQPYDDYGDMRDYRNRSRMRREYDNYDEDYRGRARNSRGQFVSSGHNNDYGDDEEIKLSKKDIKEWERDLENEDGTRGAHWDKQQIEEVAKRMGINSEEFGENILWIVTNAMYSDYCGVAKKFGIDRPEYYVELAKAFLKDKDFDGDPEEKAMLYYKCIVDKED